MISHKKTNKSIRYNHKINRCLLDKTWYEEMSKVMVIHNFSCQYPLDTTDMSKSKTWISMLLTFCMQKIWTSNFSQWLLRLCHMCSSLVCLYSSTLLSFAIAFPVTLSDMELFHQWLFWTFILPELSSDLWLSWENCQLPTSARTFFCGPKIMPYIPQDSEYT